MIKIEKINFKGREFVKTYSDQGYYITRENCLFTVALDPIVSARFYEETDIKIK